MCTISVSSQMLWVVSTSPRMTMPLMALLANLVPAHQRTFVVAVAGDQVHRAGRAAVIQQIAMA